MRVRVKRPATRRIVASSLADVIAVDAAKKRPIKRAPWERTMAEQVTMRTAGDWSQAQPRHAVALFAELHAHIYGVEAADVQAQYKQAVGLARRILEQEFDGNVAALADYVGWIWKRERAREKRGNGSGFRLAWRHVFGGRSFLVDYRVHLARQG